MIKSWRMKYSGAIDSDVRDMVYNNDLWVTPSVYFGKSVIIKYHSPWCEIWDDFWAILEGLLLILERSNISDPISDQRR